MSLNRIKKEIRKEVIEPATDSRKLFRLNRFISSRYTVIIFLILLDILLFGAINYIVNVLSHAFDWFVTQEKISYGIINIFPNLATIGQLKGVYSLLFLCMIALDIVVLYQIHTSYSEKNFNVDQKGDSRWETLEEIQEEFVEEPEEEVQEEIQEEPEEKPEQESAESRQVEMTANGGLPIVNPEDMSRVWHFAIQAMPDEDDIELALEYLEELAERSSRAVPRSVVKITGQKLNQKGLVKSIDKLLGKTILIEDAADMNERVINEFCKIIDPTDRSLLVVFIDTPASIRHLLIDYPQLAQVVTAQFVRETYSVTELLEYARGYADREDSVFDKSGELALMERLKVIAGNQERNKKRIVEMIVNNAIEKAEKKSMRKLFQSKYDKRGCLILRDKDFEVG